MTTETLYHADIALPAGFVVPTHRITVSYGNHARKEAMQDRYGDIRLPQTLSLSRFKVIEVGVIDGRVSKILFRGRLDGERDLCIVLVPRPDGYPYFCKTVWVNLNTDMHANLRRERYVAA